MFDGVEEAVEQFETLLSRLEERADQLSAEATKVNGIKRRLDRVVREFEGERKRLTSTIKKYNRDVQHIISFGRRAIELSSEPVPGMQVNAASISGVTAEKSELENRIVEAATEIQAVDGRSCGVYFLIRGSKIVYIGRSVDCYTRIAAHARDRSKVFQRAAFIPVPEPELDDIEKVLIALYKPEHNTRDLNYFCEDSLAAFNRFCSEVEDSPA